MVDESKFEWRPAVLRYLDRARMHRVALVDGRPPAEILVPKSGTTYERFRLAKNGDTLTIYDFDGLEERD